MECSFREEAPFDSERAESTVARRRSKEVLDSEAPQQCLDYASKNGSWEQSRTGGIPADNFWRWMPPLGRMCGGRDGPTLFKRATASDVLHGQWLLMIGDSRTRFMFSAMLALIRGAKAGTVSSPEGWPNHRIPTHCRSATVYQAYQKCRNLLRGECVEDDLASRNSRGGPAPGCILDYRSTMRLTFVWHATAGKLQVTETSLWKLLQEDPQPTLLPQHRLPSIVFLGVGAWDMQMRLPLPALVSGYAKTLRRLSSLFTKHRVQYGSTARPLLQVAYGNWPCAHTSPNATGKMKGLGEPEFQPASGLMDWPVHNWPSAYFVSTMASRDSFRNKSLAHGWLWLDVEHSHRTAPAMTGSPCGNQHPFGTIAEAHAQILLQTITLHRHAA